MPQALNLYNTLSRKVEEFIPIQPGKVRMYNCGPTVYNYVHIGNLRSFTMGDSLRRVFEYLGYDVQQVMNITDVGHLVSDGDEGEDKMAKGAAREGKTVLEIAEEYTQAFLKDSQQLNLLEPMARPRATEYIPEQLEMVKTLVAKGYAYVTKSAVYFDVEKLADYGKLTGQKLADKKTGVREEVVVDPEKHHPADFRLWQLDQPNHILRWETPWGEGFPGWHIECSAMSKALLGTHFDIHTGGVDHITVHHTNEIAQSEAANGEKYVNYWYHNEFLLVDGEKMSKSKGNFYILQDLLDQGFSGLDLRYFFQTAHFRQIQNFTLEALTGAKTARLKLVKQVASWLSEVEKLAAAHPLEGASEGQVLEIWRMKFVEALSEDFNLPSALAAVWELVKSDAATKDKLATVLDFDRVLGLDLGREAKKLLESAEINSPDPAAVLSLEAQELLTSRQQARESKNWAEADRLRDELAEKYGVKVRDTAEGQKWEKV